MQWKSQAKGGKGKTEDDSGHSGRLELGGRDGGKNLDLTRVFHGACFECGEGHRQPDCPSHEVDEKEQ